MKSRPKNRIGKYFCGTVWFLDKHGHMVVGEEILGEVLTASGEPDPGMTLRDEIGSTFVRMHVRVGDETTPRVVDGPVKCVFDDPVPIAHTLPGEHPLDGWHHEVDVEPTRSFHGGEPIGTSAGGPHRDVTFSVLAEHVNDLLPLLGKRIRWRGQVWLLHSIDSNGREPRDQRCELVTMQMAPDLPCKGRKQRPLHILTMMRKFRLVERHAPEGL